MSYSDRQSERGRKSMCPAVAKSQDSRWLAENGPKELESLFRSIVYHPSASILITDDGGNSRDASIGVVKLLGIPREKIIGRPIDDFAPAGSKPKLWQLSQALLQQGEQKGALQLMDSNGILREVDYTAKGNVLPVRHAVVLRDKNAPRETGDGSKDSIPSWVQDYAFYLLDTEGRVAAWYAGAARIYGYKPDEIAAHHVSALYSGEEIVRGKSQEDLNRAVAEGHVGAEGWQIRKDGSKFWANAITMALKDHRGDLQGFAIVVRDFSDRHERDEKLRRMRARVRPLPAESTIAGIVSAEFDRIPEANDTFLELVGYSREDLLEGRLRWPDLTPPEYAALDELAHEEGLRFGACTPFEKELIRKDGTRVPVLVATAVLQLSPFRWITFVQDLRERDRQESVDDQEEDIKEFFEEMVGSSVALRRVQRLIEVVAPT